MSDSGGDVCPACGAPRDGASPFGICAGCLLLQGRHAGTTVSGQAAPETEMLTDDDLALLFPELEVIRLVGRGGMGVVYQARQLASGTMVALKILPSERSGDPQFSERFRREAAVLASLEHPNIVSLYDFGERGDFLYFLMEFVDGVDLAERIRCGSLTTAELLRIVPQICVALEYSHNNGVVHRDIKPGNILINHSGEVKIADFGLARFVEQSALESRLTLTDMAVGTPRYMAPEQMENSPSLDHRVDIYALGVVLYEMLTGELPIGSFEPPSEKRRELDERMDDVILRAMNPVPEERHDSASAVNTGFTSALKRRTAFALTDRSKSLLIRIAPASIIGLAISAALVFFVSSDFLNSNEGDLKERRVPNEVLLPVGKVVNYSLEKMDDAEVVPPILVDVKVAAISVSSADQEFGAAIVEGGDVVAWGANQYGQVTVPAELKHVVAVSTGKGPKAAHCLALDARGRVTAWGDDSYRQASVPDAALTDVVQIAAGQFHSIALRRDGSVIAWGYELDGVTTVPEGLADVTAIAAGAWFSAALTAEGRVFVWGAERASGCAVPGRVRGLPVTLIAAGTDHIAAVAENGEVLIWGQYHRLRTHTFSEAPVERIAAERNVTVAIDADNCLFILENGSSPTELVRRPLGPLRPFLGVGIHSSGVLAIQEAG